MSLTTNAIVPFNKPHKAGKELEYIAQAHAKAQLAGDGPFTALCSRWIERQTGTNLALLTHSCTAALEMTALLLDIRPGDEIIMPSFTFVSTANAFVLRGAIPVFVDIREDTLNIDERLIEAAISPNTKAIVVVHYAGVACEMDEVLSISARHGIPVVEDAAQALMSSYKNRPLGALGTLGAVSFHETKNVVAGEGGALLINDSRFAERAEIIREKGTNRSRFFRGQVDKYTWVDLGSSYLPGEMVAAFLYAQMEQATEITNGRLTIWNAYKNALSSLEGYRHPVVPAHCTHNAHMFYLLAPDLLTRTRAIASLKAAGLVSVFHYVPLHSSPAGLKYGRVHGNMRVTDQQSDRLIRLPLWLGMPDDVPQRVLETLQKITVSSAS